MTSRVAATLVASMLLFHCGVTYAQAGYVPPLGFVPNAETAVAVVRAILTPIYDPQLLKREEPLVAEQRGDTWFVHGTLPCPRPNSCLGGVVEVVIAKKDARIISVVHSQ